MKRLFLLITIFTAANISYTMVSQAVKLPPAAILKARVSQVTSAHFVESTKIDQILANQLMHPVVIVGYVEGFINEYVKDNPSMTLSKMLASHKPALLRAILQESPQAIELLDKQKLLQGHPESQSTTN